MRRQRWAVAAAVAAGLAVAVLVGQAQQPAPKIDPKADQHLKAMSKYLAGLKTFTFQVEEFFDDVQDDGQKLQFSNQRRVTVRRPDHVAGETEGDTASTRFFYDGKKVTVYDKTNKTYAVEKTAGRDIDAMLDELHSKYDTTQPLADFLFSDPYKVLTEHVRGGEYVGLHHVGKTKCHHLAFRQRLLDWQIWIDAGETPLPRKLVITFRRQAGEPQYYAFMHRWDVNPKVADGAFQFTPPEGVRKVDFLNRHGDAKAKKGPIK
jgi:hypothetical protein